jgi:MFS family permease
VSAIATPPHGERAHLEVSGRTISDRLLAVVPLLSVYFWLCIVYVYEAWGRVTPWLFTDELERTQLARAVAETGHAARRGAPHSWDTLYTFLIAPAWWLGSTHASYDAVKYIGVFVMASVLFPTYFLARLVVGRFAALFAATGAAAVPALAYSSWIVEEPLAYPYAALCFFLVAKALFSKRRPWIVAAVLACLIAPSVRGELVVIPITLLLACIFFAWSSPWGLRRRATWSTGDWVGTVVLGLGALFLLSGYLSHHVYEWYVTTYKYKHRMFSLGLWAAGAFTIGVGVLPVVAGLASLRRVRGEEHTRGLRVFRCVALAGLIAVGFYAFMKAAYLSTVFATRVEERNIIYIAPLLFVGTAIVLERRRVDVLALAGATALALWMMITTPYQMGVQLYSDALGLAILQQANRFLLWTPWFAQWLMLAITAVGATAFLALRFLGNRRTVSLVVVGVLGVFMIGWNLTAEIAAAAGTNSISRESAQTLGKPYDWVDQIAHRKPTLYLGQGVADQNGEWLMEFWNRSIISVGSLDGTIDGPGPAGGPNIAADGETYWTNDPANPGIEYDYAVEEAPCVDFAGKLVATHSYRAGGKFGGGHWRLIQLTHPNRLRAECNGINPDGWTGPANSGYFRFSGPKVGHMVITVSRADWGGAPVPSPIHVLIGTLIVDANHQPRLGRVLSDKTSTINRLETKTFVLPTPGSRFAARVIVDDKFIPHQLDPSNSDVRQLGAVVTYTWVPGPVPQAAHT